MASRKPRKRPRLNKKALVPIKGRIGGPPHEPTPERKRFVAMLADLGITKTAMCYALDIDYRTLVKHYPQELTEGRDITIATAAGHFFQKHVLGETASSVSAFIFWAKTRWGWREETAPPPTQPPHIIVELVRAAKKGEGE